MASRRLTIFSFIAAAAPKAPRCAFATIVVFGGEEVWRAIEPMFGLVQRSLFACFFVWCFGVGWLLWASAEGQLSPNSRSTAL